MSTSSADRTVDEIREFVAFMAPMNLLGPEYGPVLEALDLGDPEASAEALYTAIDAIPDEDRTEGLAWILSLVAPFATAGNAA